VVSSVIPEFGRRADHRMWPSSLRAVSAMPTQRISDWPLRLHSFRNGAIDVAPNAIAIRACAA
jgi:hypothetical protein